MARRQISPQGDIGKPGTAVPGRRHKGIPNQSRQGRYWRKLTASSAKDARPGCPQSHHSGASFLSMTLATPTRIHHHRKSPHNALTSQDRYPHRESSLEFFDNHNLFGSTPRTAPSLGIDRDRSGIDRVSPLFEGIAARGAPGITPGSVPVTPLDFGIDGINPATPTRGSEIDLPHRDLRLHRQIPR